MESPDKRQFLDEHGYPLKKIEIPAPGPVKKFLEQVGLLHPLRVVRSLLVFGNRWRGPRGEVMAAVLRKGMKRTS